MMIAINFIIIFTEMFLMGQQSSQVTDPKAIIDILDQAQKANETRYPSGRLKFSIDREYQNGVGLSRTPFERIEAEVVWRENRTHTKLIRYGSSNPQYDKESKGITLHPEETVVNGSRFFAKYGKEMIIIQPTAERTILDEHQATPQNYWYRNQVATDMPCIDVFKRYLSNDPDLKNYRINNIVVNGKEVQLSLNDQSTKSTFDAHYNYDLDGNLTYFASLDPQHGTKKTAS